MTRFVGQLVTSGEFTDEKTGSKVAFENHYMHFVTDKPDDPAFIGEETYVVKVGRSVYDRCVDPKLKPGMLCDVRHNREGRLISITVVSDPANLMRK